MYDRMLSIFPVSMPKGNCFRFAYSASALEDQRPCGKVLCSSSVEAFVCLNFGSLASHWPRPWSDFGVPLGAGRLPKGGPETSKRQPQTTQTASLECLWGAFGGRASRGGLGASRRQLEFLSLLTVYILYQSRTSDLTRMGLLVRRPLTGRV